MLITIINLTWQLGDVDMISIFQITQIQTKDMQILLALMEDNQLETMDQQQQTM